MSNAVHASEIVIAHMGRIFAGGGTNLNELDDRILKVASQWKIDPEELCKATSAGLRDLARTIDTYSIPNVKARAAAWLL